MSLEIFQRRDNFFRGLFTAAHAIGDPDAVIGIAGEGESGK